MRRKITEPILFMVLVISIFFHYQFGIEEARQRKFMQNEINVLNEKLLDKQEEIETLKIMLEQEEKEQDPEPEYLGKYIVTHYCLENYPHICNDGESRVTASGQTPVPYYTVAADKSLEFGTKLIIEGNEYEVMDRGGMIEGNRLDIAVKTHPEALQRGIAEVDVFRRQ